MSISYFDIFINLRLIILVRLGTAYNKYIERRWRNLIEDGKDKN